MEVLAESKYIRVSPRKMRLVVDSLREMSLEESLQALGNLNKRAAKPILATLKQAIGNAVGNFGLKKESLVLKEIQVGEAPTLKRWRAVGRGRARSIFKRASHLRVVLSGKEPVKETRSQSEKKKESHGKMINKKSAKAQVAEGQKRS